MKARNLFFVISLAVVALFFSSCEMDHLKPESEFGILPERFKVDIPNSLSNADFHSSLKSTANDTISGNAIYGHLSTFIAAGEAAADIVAATIWAIHFYQIEDVIFLSYTSDEDKRVKNLEVVKNVTFRDREWEYLLIITDAESAMNEDEGIGMQVFWNKNPIEGIALYKPYNLNRKKNQHAEKAMAGIEYSEKGTGEYETYMIVEITGLPLPEGILEPFGMETMKMFVGKKGDVVDVYGNSNHPNFQLNPNDDEAIGFNWAFVASGNDSKDIAVAEVGLPASSADLSQREEILTENSVKNVITRELTRYVVSQYAKYGLTLNPEEVNALVSPYLKNADAPGYFNTNGFVCGGMAPNGQYTELETNIQALVPYNPYAISHLTISFY